MIHCLKSVRTFSNCKHHYCRETKLFAFLAHKEDQIQCEKLFADYTILLKLVRLSDNVFGVVLQSYYGSQVLNKFLVLEKFSCLLVGFCSF